MKPKTLNEEINRIKNIMGFINESMDEPTGETQEFNGKTYPSHHGSPFDRGSADSWYSRGTNPHKNHPEYSEDLTPEEVDAYYAGYYWNERHGGREEYEDDTDRMGDDDLDESPIHEGFWSSIFGNPSVKDAAHTQMKSQGYSHIGRDEERKEENYLVFNGEKFYPEQIEYADYQDLGDLPRIEDGKLIIANPAWNM